MIIKAEYNDLQEILNLQYLSYQSEAELFGRKNVPPLRQTLNEVIDEFNKGIILKMVIDNTIIGSVRAIEKNNTVEQTDRKWYEFDCTFDDGKAIVNRKWFNKSRDTMGCDYEHILENESFKPLSAEDMPESDYLVFA